MKKYLNIFIFFIFFNVNSANAEDPIIKGIVVSECTKIVDLYDLDNDRAEEVLSSVFQAFLSGYNVNYYMENKRFKKMEFTTGYLFESIMQKCKFNKEEKVWLTLYNFWNELEWGIQ